MKKSNKFLLIFIILILSGILMYFGYQYDQEQSALARQLRKAVEQNNISAVTQLLAVGANNNRGNPKTGENPLATAIKNGNLEIVKLIIPHSIKATAIDNALDYALATIINHGLSGYPTQNIKEIINYLIGQKISTKISPIVVALLTNQNDLAHSLFDKLDLKTIPESILNDIRGAASLSGNVSIQRAIDFVRHEKKQKTSESSLQ